MATSYGTTSRRVSSGDIHSIVADNMTITSEGEDSFGGYYLTAYINSNAPGCGNPLLPTLTVSVKNDILQGWNKITFKSYGTFTTACWNLNDGANINNLQSYSTAAGDRIFKAKNCFELPQFAVKTSACDNNSDNAFHPSFAVSNFREWFQTRRRNSLTSPAGPSITLSCNSVGTGSVIIISDIHVFI